MVTKWRETDPETLQHCRQLQDGVYEIYQTSLYDDVGEYYVYKLCHGIICINEIDIDDVVYDAGCSSEAEFREKFRDNWKEQAAIAWLEMYIDDYWIAYPCFSRTEAKDVIAAMISGDAAANTEIRIC